MRVLMRHRQIRLYLASQAVSGLGDSALWLAAAIWVKTLTGSAAAAGLVMFFFAASALCAPAFGTLVDRVRGTRLLVGANLAGAAVVLPLLLVDGPGQVWVVYAVMAVYGATSRLIQPAMSALLVSVAPDEALAAANGLARSIQEAIRILAPLLGAAMFAWLGPTAVVLFDAATFVAAAGILALMRVPTQISVQDGSSVLREAVEGARYVARHPVLGWMVGGFAVAVLAVGFGESGLFAVVGEGLGRGPAFIGVLMTVQGVAAVAIGPFAGALCRPGRELRVLRFGLVAYAASLLLLTVPTLPTVLASMALAGVGLPLAAIGAVTCLQRNTPHAMQGRAYAVLDMALSVPQAISILAGATLLGLFGFQLSFGVGVAVLLCGAALTLRALPLNHSGSPTRAPLTNDEEPAMSKRSDILVHQCVERSAALDPDHPAVADPHVAMTYGQLNAQANRVAHWLVAAGVGAEQVVGVVAPSGADVLVAELGALKAGAAYLPLDPANPDPWLAQALREAGVSAVVTSRVRSGWQPLPGVPTISVDADELAGYADKDLDRDIDPDHPAYLMRTSGSTGVAKCVMIAHGSLAGFSRWWREEFGYVPSDRTTQIYSAGFDAWGVEVWPALTAGVEIRTPAEEVRLSPEALRDWLVDSGITYGYMPTALGEHLFTMDWPRQGRLRALLTGGDRLHSRPAQDPGFRLVNMYGPAEATVVVTIGDVTPRTEGVGLPPIGHPIGETRARVLDPDLRPVPDGEIGELCLGGPALARGYRDRPALTAERFVPNDDPTDPGGRLYRTGDLVRRLPDGELEFIGRADDQVKVRGHRIEIGEIVAAVVDHPDVAAAHVAPFEPDGAGTALVAYVVPAVPTRVPGAAHLREFLRERLPAAMVPRAFIVLTELPMNVNGKVDRKALPDPAAHQLATFGGGRPPRDGVEAELLELWRDALRAPRAGVVDNFFDLGGNSLLAAKITNRIRVVFDVGLSMSELFDAPTVEALAEVVAARRGVAVGRSLPPVTHVEIEPDRRGLRRGPVSVQQEQAWFLNRMSPDTPDGASNRAYHAQTTIRVVGAFDLGILRQAVTEIANRHEILRTTYEESPGGLSQVIHPPAPVGVTVIDLTKCPEGQRADRLAQLTERELHRPFDLTKLPLARWTAVRLGEREHELILVEHHLVHDGWSFGLMAREVAALYRAYASGEAPDLPPLPVQYSDYARWQRAALDSGDLDGQLDYWRGKLAGAPEPLGLPTDRPRPRTQTFHGDQLRFDLPAGLTGALRTVARGEGATLFGLMYAVYVALVHRRSGEADISVGTAFANRRARATEDLIGMFVNAAVLRCAATPDEPFRQLLRRASQVALEATENQEYPFPTLVHQLGVTRDLARNPLFQTMFSFHDSAVRDPDFAGSFGTVFERSNASAKLDLDVVVIPRAERHLGDSDSGDDRMTMLWEFNADLFDRRTVDDLAAQYVRMLRAVVADPACDVGDLPLLSGQERRAVLASASGGPSAAAAGASVVAEVARWGASAPDAVAVTAPDGELTYGDLCRDAASLAAGLRAAGAGPDDVVGVLLPRGSRLTVAMLGVLASGAAYLPIDPSAPPARIEAVLADAGVRHTVTGDNLAHWLAAGQAAAPLPLLPPPAARLAYVIYTSGSTGKPKGVLVEHRAMHNFVAWRRQEYGYEPGDRVTVVYSPGFDSSIGEILPALMAGATLHVPDDDLRLNPDRLVAWLADRRITVAEFPVTLAEQVVGRLAALPPEAVAPLRVLVTGGERLRVRPPAGAGYELVNEYGPSETSVAVTYARVAPSADGTPPPIGRPIAGAVTYVLDQRMRPVPDGAVGEVYVGGDPVGRGYLNRPAETAARFVPDPFAATPGARLYRTGDVARRRNDGALDYLGRMDNQLKIRGFRIEPGEIEVALRGHPSVETAFVTAWHNPGTGDPMLVAYAVPADPHAPAPAAAALRAWLGERLPSYLVPGALVFVDALPLNPNGKVDQGKLPDPLQVGDPAAGGAGDGTTSYPVGEEPSNDLERWLARMWCDVLGLERVGVDESFFDLGGHSLLLGRLHSEISDTLGRDLPMVTFFQHTTVRALAGHLADAERPSLLPV